jgi:hypothetical protein
VAVAAVQGAVMEEAFGLLLLWLQLKVSGEHSRTFRNQCSLSCHLGQNTSPIRGNTTVPKTQKPTNQNSVQNKTLMSRALLLFWIVALVTVG